MDRATSDLRDFYEDEARLRKRKTVRSRRLGLRTGFLSLLREEGRTSIVDLGCGPAIDGGPFRAAGLRFVGVDLAHGNAVIAAEDDLTVLQGSVTAVPLRSSTCEAGWSASTLMHLPEPAAGQAVDELVRVLKPGSPMLIGLWGNETERSENLEGEIPGRRRVFHLRSRERNRQLFASRATIEREEWWEEAAPGEDYQIFQLRSSD